MRIRHRVPTIFNLSMVDVLCCALGCVILLWLLNQRVAREEASAAEQTGQRLSQQQRSLDTAEQELQAVRQSLAASRLQVGGLEQQALAGARKPTRCARRSRKRWARSASSPPRRRRCAASRRWRRSSGRR